jgi:hypothetical protein
LFLEVIDVWKIVCGLGSKCVIRLALSSLITRFSHQTKRVEESNDALKRGLAEVSFEMKVNKLSRMTLRPLKQWGVSIADFFALAIRRDRMPQVRCGVRWQI